MIRLSIISVTHLFFAVVVAFVCCACLLNLGSVPNNMPFPISKIKKNYRTKRENTKIPNEQPKQQKLDNRISEICLINSNHPYKNHKSIFDSNWKNNENKAVYRLNVITPYIHTCIQTSAVFQMCVFFPLRMGSMFRCVSLLTNGAHYGFQCHQLFDFCVSAIVIYSCNLWSIALLSETNLSHNFNRPTHYYFSSFSFYIN